MKNNLFLRNNHLFLILLLLLLVIFWPLWQSGNRVAPDSPLVSINSLKQQFNLPMTWDEAGTDGLGQSRTLTLWSWPLSLVSGALANLNMDFSSQIKLLYLGLFIVVGSFSIWKFCRKFNLSDKASFVAALFYLANTYILLVIDGGQLRIALAYAFFPACFLAVEEAIGGSLRKKFWAATAIAVLGFFDLRFIYILFFLSLIRFFYGFFLNLKKWQGWLREWITLGIIAGLVAFGLNFYWIYPLIKFPPKDNLYTSLIQTSFLSFATLGHSLLMLSPHWFKNIFGQVSPILPEFIIIPIFVFLAAMLRRKNYWVGFWLLVALISTFLVKGALEPLPQVYPWLYFHIPGFSLFRDSTKFFFIVLLSYAFLMAVTFDEIARRFKAGSRMMLAVMSAYLLLLIAPLWTGQMTGLSSRHQDETLYQRIRQVFSGGRQFSRIFWIPSVAPLGGIDRAHPVVEASRLVSQRPFGAGVKGTYEVFNFLREALYMGQIFDIAGIGYIAYPPLDLKRGNYSRDDIKYYRTFSNQLAGLPWLSKLDNLPVFKVKQHQDKFFTAANTWWVVGPDSLYNEATKSADLKLSDNAFIFAEESPGMLGDFEKFKNSKIILYQKNMTDLAGVFIDDSRLIFPATYLSRDPNQSGWWKRDEADLIGWRYFLKTKYGLDNLDFGFGGGWAVGEGDKKLQITNSKLQKGNILLARAMESSRSGELKFYQNDQLIGKVETKVGKDTDFHWFEIGKLNSGDEVAIRSHGDINVVNALAVLPEAAWTKLKSKADDLQKNGQVWQWKDVVNYRNTSTKPTVSYQEINPILYKIRLSNVEKPITLAFSENYNPYWKLDGRRGEKLYSLINGFEVDHDGQYQVSFAQQKVVIPGLLVSVVTILLILAGIFIPWKN